MSLCYLAQDISVNRYPMAANSGSVQAQVGSLGHAIHNSMVRLYWADLFKHQQELQSSLQRLGYPNMYSDSQFSPVFEEFDSPTGRGLRAIRDLPRGTPILYEAAFFVISKGGDLPADKIADVRFQALSCPYNNPTPRQRFVVNRYWVAKDDRGDNISGLFLQASRINHSCVPNASCTGTRNCSDSQYTQLSILHETKRSLWTTMLETTSKLQPSVNGDYVRVTASTVDAQLVSLVRVLAEQATTAGTRCEILRMTSRQTEIWIN